MYYVCTARHLTTIEIIHLFQIFVLKHEFSVFLAPSHKKRTQTLYINNKSNRPPAHQVQIYILNTSLCLSSLNVIFQYLFSNFKGVYIRIQKEEDLYKTILFIQNIPKPCIPVNWITFYIYRRLTTDMRSTINILCNMGILDSVFIVHTKLNHNHLHFVKETTFEQYIM